MAEPSVEPVYPVVFLDALRVKIRHEGVVRNKAVSVALALSLSGEKEVLGLWIEQSEGARFWLGVLNELKTRGAEDILIAVVDGLKGDAAQGSVGPSPMEWQRRVPRGDRGGIPADDGADLHRASDPQRAGDGELEGP